MKPLLEICYNQQINIQEIGVDEAGRGQMLGRVYSAAVILPKNIEDYKHWSIWTCEPSKFDWEFDQEEHCYIIEGKVQVIGSENTVDIEPGD